MKGFDNNPAAVNILNNLNNSLDNRIREVYNLGYRQGFTDGTDAAIKELTDRIFGELLVDDKLDGCKDSELYTVVGKAGKPRW